MEFLHHYALALLLAAIALAADTSSRGVDCCEALATQPKLQGKVYYPDTTSYNERMGTYWSLSAALDPWCMVLPETTDDVSIAITTIVKHECPFGIRGGGHGTHALSNSVQDGVTMDMGYFNATTYSSETKIASIGPGANWGSVYDTLTPYGVTVTGGRAASVGVGGFVTGGGNSFHSASHGFACDQVQNFELVLADGRVVNANEQENPGLWKSLKGGSGNFGLVTRYDLHAIEFDDPSKPYIWGGIVGYNYTQSESIIDAFVNFTNNVEDDVYSSSILTWSYNPASIGFSIQCILDNVANEAYPPAFNGYLNITGKTSNSLRSATMSNITQELNRPRRTFTIWLTGTYKNDARVLRFIYRKHEDMMLNIEKTIGPDSGMFSSLQAQPLTKPMISRGRGMNVLGLEERIKTGPGFILLMYFGVDSAQDEKTAIPYVERFYREVDAYASSLGANWDWHYLNYARGTQDPISGYGNTSVQLLRETSHRYDPKGVFQRLRHSGFKVFQ